MTDAKKELGLRIRHFRRVRGWTVDMFADRCGVSRSAVKSWERGRTAPNIRLLHKVVHDVFGVSMPGFFRLDVPVEEPKRADDSNASAGA